MASFSEGAPPTRFFPPQKTVEAVSFVELVEIRDFTSRAGNDGSCCCGSVVAYGGRTHTQRQETTCGVKAGREAAALLLLHAAT